MVTGPSQETGTPGPVSEGQWAHTSSVTPDMGPGEENWTTVPHGAVGDGGWWWLRWGAVNQSPTQINPEENELPLNSWLGQS